MPQQAARLVRQVQDVFSADENRTLVTQIQIARIPAPTSAESARAVWMLGLFERIGYSARIDDIGNLVARRAGTTDAAPVVVCAHLDTVFAHDVPHEVREAEGRFIGPGIGDNARGLAGLIAIARMMDALELRTRHPIIFACTVGEEGEGDLRGARHLFANDGANAIAAVALDGAGDQRIVTHAIGSRRFRITIHGAGGHSWSAADTPNPLHAAADFGARLSRLSLRDTPRTTLALTRLHSGEAVNAIPASAVLDVEVRSLDAQPLRDAAHAVQQLLAAALQHENSRPRASPHALTATSAITSDRPAGSAAHDSAPVRLALAATEAIGRSPELASASTDANIPLSLGIPAIAIGAGGSGGDAHTTHEWFVSAGSGLGLARAYAIIAGLAVDTKGSPR